LVEIDAEGVYSSQRPCSTDFLYTQGVARNISDRELKGASLQGQQESARRIGAHTGQIRSAYRQLQQQIKVRQRQEAEAESIQKIRDAIWRISKAEQIDDVLCTIHDSLRGLDIDFYGISINHVDKSRSIVRHYSFAGEEMRTLRDAPQHRDMLAALRELGVPVDGMSMQFPAILTVAGETTPCALMEQQQEGLLAALDADMRGGVFGPVQRTGCIQRGDRITVLAAS
jgi:hypothetical protein